MSRAHAIHSLQFRRFWFIVSAAPAALQEVQFTQVVAVKTDNLKYYQLSG